MTSAEDLRAKAQQCRRLGAGQDPRTILALSTMAEEYDAEALVLDAAVAPAIEPPDADL